MKVGSANAVAAACPGTSASALAIGLRSAEPQRSISPDVNPAQTGLDLGICGQTTRHRAQVRQTRGQDKSAFRANRTSALLTEAARAGLPLARGPGLKLATSRPSGAAADRPKRRVVVREWPIEGQMFLEVSEAFDCSGVRSSSIYFEALRKKQEHDEPQRA